MLNLLPPNEKKSLLGGQKKRLFTILGIELLVFLICILFVLLAVEFYILGETTTQSYLYKQVQYENQSLDFLEFKNKILKYNKELVLTDSFHKNQKFIYSALDVLLDVKRPDGMYFTNFSLQSDERSDKINVNISGFSDIRDNLLIFRKNIESEKKIGNINFSPESWINQKNVNFNLTLEITDGD
jgi:hypothetical protein